MRRLNDSFINWSVDVLFFILLLQSVIFFPNYLFTKVDYQLHNILSVFNIWYAMCILIVALLATMVGAYLNNKFIKIILVICLYVCFVIIQSSMHKPNQYVYFQKSDSYEEFFTGVKNLLGVAYKPLPISYYFGTKRVSILQKTYKKRKFNVISFGQIYHLDLEVLWNFKDELSKNERYNLSRASKDPGFYDVVYNTMQDHIIQGETDKGKLIGFALADLNKNIKSDVWELKNIIVHSLAQVSK